jgi:threonine dehydratase
MAVVKTKTLAHADSAVRSARRSAAVSSPTRTPRSDAIHIVPKGPATRRTRPGTESGFTSNVAAEAEAFLRPHPEFKQTPMRRLEWVAHALGLGGVSAKDESTRMGMGSFKALGGAYAVMRIAAARCESLIRVTSLSELSAVRTSRQLHDTTFCCATDGNHGRAVAEGARFVGARAVVFVHEAVDEVRSAALVRAGAQPRRVPGNYEAAVQQAKSESAARGWILVSDTSDARDDHPWLPCAWRSRIGARPPG